jgi:predicted outer membrane repeat protein
VAIATAALLTAPAAPAHADPVTVTCGPDLQAAIDDATDGAQITVEAPEEGACTGASYTLPARPPDFSITLAGAGDGVTLSGSGSDAAHPRLITGTDTGRVTISNMTLRDSFSGPGQDGGALYADGDSEIVLVNLRFLANRASGSGGAVYVESSGTPPLIANSVFGSDDEGEGNSAGEDGGAVAIENALADDQSTLEVLFSRFSGNAAGRSGGGLAIDDGGAGHGGLRIGDDTFDRNTATREGAGASVRTATDVTLGESSFSRNELTAAGAPGRGAGLFAVATAPGLKLSQESASFDDNGAVGPAGAEFGGAGAGEWVGGFDFASRDDRVTRNRLAASGGDEPVSGAGIEIDGCGEAAPADRTVRFENLAVAGNTIGAGGDGAGVHLAPCGGHGMATTMINSTIAGNRAAADGGTAGLAGDAGTGDTLTIRNSIVAVNGGGPDLSGWAPANRAVSFSDVCAPGAVPGSGNICADPRLVAPGPSSGDVHETQFSPTVDHGANGAVPEDLTLDYDDDVRTIGPVVDMGADEYSSPTAITSSTRFVGPFGATLTGVVDPNTHETNYRFEYGRTAAYGRRTPTRPGQVLLGTLLVSERIQGLRPSTRYHFRVVAMNLVGGRTVGMDHSFRTDPDPFGGAGLPDRAVTVRDGRAPILVTCPNGTPGGCTGKLTLRRPGRSKPFAGARFRLAKGHFRRVRVRLPKSQRKALERAGPLDVRAVTTAHDAYVTRKRRATIRLEP